MANSFTRPPRIKGGGITPIKAADINQVGRCIEELQNAIRTTTGKSSPFVPSRLPPFWGSVTQVPESDPPEYQAVFSPGYLTYQNATSVEAEQGTTGYISPKIENEDGEMVDMEQETVPPVPLPGVVSFVYLRVKTDADGAPKFDGDSVTIEAFDSAQQSVHHVRPSPSGGEEEGDYYFLLLETESNGATPTPAPRVKRRITGNREMPNQLVEITNIGDGREIYEGYLPGPDDKHQFRSLKQFEDGDQYEAPVIAPLEEGEEESDTINFVGLGVLQPDSGSSPRRPAKFEIGDDNKVSKLNFTGIDGEVTIPSTGGTFEFGGGLAIGFSGNAPEDSLAGIWGTIGIQYAPPVGSIQSLLLGFQEGRLVSVTNTQGQLGTGTQADPIESNFQVG